MHKSRYNVYRIQRVEAMRVAQHDVDRRRLVADGLPAASQAARRIPNQPASWSPAAMMWSHVHRLPSAGWMRVALNIRPAARTMSSGVACRSLVAPLKSQV